MKTIKGIIVSALLTMQAGLLVAQEGNTSSAANKPDVKITVHKRTDRDGNVISYDSTYSYTYSGKGGDTAMINDMLKQFGAGMNTMFQGGFTDSISMPSFMDNPFFKQFNMQNIDMNKLQQSMDEQMQQFMQGNGWPLPNKPDSVPLPAPVKPCPAQKHLKHPAKKVSPKQNNADGGVQI